MLACVIENLMKVSVNEYVINPLYCVSSPGYGWQCGLKYTGINLQTLQDKDKILLLENNIRGFHFPFAPENEKSNPDDFSDYMKTIEPDTYTSTKKFDM